MGANGRDGPGYSDVRTRSSRGVTRAGLLQGFGLSSADMGKAPTYTCTRCNTTGTHRGDWNGIFRDGLLVEVCCPGCQTLEENAEAVVKEATLEYRRGRFGEWTTRPKVS